MTDQSRQPRGIPTGGQFASTRRAEAGVTLGQPVPRLDRFSPRATPSPTLARADRFWDRLGRMMPWTPGDSDSRAGRVSLASQCGMFAGFAVITGAAVAGAPVVAAGGLGVMVVSVAGALGATVASVKDVL